MCLNTAGYVANSDIHPSKYLTEVYTVFSSLFIWLLGNYGMLSLIMAFAVGLCCGFMTQSTQWGHAECGQFT